MAETRPKASIFRPARQATQSGTKKTQQWVLTFNHDGSRDVEPVMGWTRSSDMLQELELHLKFDSLEEAIRFAKSRGLEYEVHEPATRRVIPKSYAENFK